MKVYLLGVHGQSNTNGKAFITVELLPNHTDMRGLTLYHGKHITNPFYRPLKLNAGKVIRITDLEEEYDFTGAMVMVGAHKYNLELGKYFYLATEPDVTELETEHYLTAYQFKSAVLEASEYVARGYNGVAWVHYNGGNVRHKMYYKSGNLRSRFYYRDDVFNSLETVRQYQDGVLDSEFTYDAREALTRQRWFDSKGKIYHKINIKAQTEPPLSPIPEINVEEVQVKEVEVQVQVQVQTQPDEPQARVSDTEDDDEEPPPVPGQGLDIGGVRFKPRTEDEDEDEDEDESCPSSGSEDIESESNA
jgi:antitoxin component YwqK of YwqJK toxin-antitoxin module